ncbi:hypothetical protein KC19_11G117900 [Ceratodon purpureus]|uniref:Uncharacterized protein n=1 Tax=Ceratodon purpureus TaxID=3225 RepID=A0A8T0GFI0_CERPU|nr:hypothetical protein KC19_11G117900 [Ceratodon purpureus]
MSSVTLGTQGSTRVNFLPFEIHGFEPVIVSWLESYLYKHLNENVGFLRQMSFFISLDGSIFCVHFVSLNWLRFCFRRKSLSLIVSHSNAANALLTMDCIFNFQRIHMGHEA